MSVIISPSLLSADFGNLNNEIDMINASAADWLHIDVSGAIMTVHYEACTHLHRVVQQIHAAGMQAGVSLNPHTPVSLLEDIIEDVDLVLLMSVNPGFGGQKFIPRILDKVRDLKEMIARRNSHAVIEIDGGVNLDTGRQLVEAGADALVAGSFVFHSDNPIDTIARLKQL